MRLVRSLAGCLVLPPRGCQLLMGGARLSPTGPGTRIQVLLLQAYESRAEASQAAWNGAASMVVSAHAIVQAIFAVTGLVPISC